MLTQRGLGPCVSYAETVECWIVLSVECRVEDVRRGQDVEDTLVSSV